MNQIIARFGSPNSHYCKGLDEANKSVPANLPSGYTTMRPRAEQVIQIKYGTKIGLKITVDGRSPLIEPTYEEIPSCPFCCENLIRPVR